MAGSYSNEEFFYRISKLLGDIKNVTNSIEENEILTKKEVGTKIQRFIEDSIQSLYEAGLITKKDFYALPREFQIVINKLLVDFDVKLFEEIRPKLF